jgi:nucleotide-binding universal stress UspA family protein
VSTLRRSAKSPPEADDAASAEADHWPLMMLHRIIAPVTFAEDTLEATLVAAELAGALGAELVLAGIVPLVQPEPAEAPDARGALARSAREQELVDRIVGERVAELSAAIPEAIRRRTLLTYGPVGMALVNASREQRADLVVVPMRRESGLAHLLHDHPDRYVLHHSRVPVLVVPTLGSSTREELRPEAA